MQSLAIGALLALGAVLGAHLWRIDRGRSFYPLVLLAVGFSYVPFAIAAGDAMFLTRETAVFAGFAILSTAAFRTGGWIVVAGLSLHALFDLTRGQFLPARTIPDWWPEACVAFDATAALGLAALMLLGSRGPRRT